jgi:hypothetical protein
MPTEANAVPPILYKYLQPDRLDVLANCRVRFSQRRVFEDDHELQPDYAKFGTSSEIWRFVISKGLRLDPAIPPNILVELIAMNPNHQQRAIQAAVSNIKSLRVMGIFCLTEVADCDRMWNEYAGEGGFVIGFDTTHESFNALRLPGLFGRVSYSDAAFETFLGMMETEPLAPLFRKRMKYSFEREWRSIRQFKELERHPDVICLSPFDPACVREVIMRSECVVRRELREIIANDGRYADVQISVHA